MRRPLLVMVAMIGLALMAPANARACDCGPTVGPLQGGGGVVDADSGTHYTAIPLRRGTMVESIDARGNTLSWHQLGGIWGVPQVANDGSTGGLSGNGRVLVLEDMAMEYPRRQSSFAVLRARRMSLRSLVRLRGDWSFDAISPSGDRMYLIEHPRPGLASYRVRAYDLTAGRLLPRPITDPTEWQQIMHGVAVTRVVSADGARVYTLYDRGNGRMFVHALNTVAGTARCIDIPRIAGAPMVTLKLWGDGSRLDVSTDGTSVYRINTDTFGIDPVAAVATTPETPAHAAATGDGGGAGWLAPLLGLAAALAGAGLVLLALRRGEGRLRMWRPRSG
jgi:hypothetical protein